MFTNTPTLEEIEKAGFNLDELTQQSPNPPASQTEMKVESFDDRLMAVENWIKLQEEKQAENIKQPNLNTQQPSNENTF